jgi:hypothetical protein
MLVSQGSYEFSLPLSVEPQNRCHVLLHTSMFNINPLQRLFDDLLWCFAPIVYRLHAHMSDKASSSTVDPHQLRYLLELCST